MQHAGSFKPRGAFNRLLSAELSAGRRDRGVWRQPRRRGRLCRTRPGRAGGDLRPGRHARRQSRPHRQLWRARRAGSATTYAEALTASRGRQGETGALEVHAYDHADVLAGQGTVGREFEQDAPDLTHILVATGGGGLIGGIAAWYAGSAEIISVEPEGCPALHDALRAGHPVEAPVGGLAADSLGARLVGALMFPIAQRFVSQAVLVPDDAILAAQRLLWDRHRLIAEPGGATAAAAVLSGRFQPPRGARVGVLVCGANTDPAKLAG